MQGNWIRELLNRIQKSDWEGGNPFFLLLKLSFENLGGSSCPPTPWIRPWKAAVHLLFGNPFYILYDICILLLHLKFTPLTPPRFFFQYIFSPDIAWNDYRYSINFCWKCLKLNDLYGHYGYCWKEREANSQELTTRRTKGDERVKDQPLFWKPWKK